mmetsp:Transcript_21811/g.62114  ORF Transcript_21811/g.62114 Transcript_21811/m.62114 type:complete len:266 (+) Transcript_21811:2414-3211(+)
MSILFISTTLAASTCSANSSGTLRLPEHSSPSSTQPNLSPAISHDIQSVPKVHESIIVTVWATFALVVTGLPAMVASFQFCWMATGSATPDSSTTTASNGSSVLRADKTFSTLVSSSSANVQQAHPFCISTTPPGEFKLDAELPADTNLASMLTLATSFTMMPILIPSVLSSRCWSVVVFPDPRNPASRVMGTCDEEFFGIEILALLALAASNRNVDDERDKRRWSDGEAIQVRWKPPIAGCAMRRLCKDLLWKRTEQLGENAIA